MSAEPVINELDNFDRKILRIVQVEPQISMVELAKHIGLSHTPTWRRYRRLEERGIILGRPVMLNPAALGYTVNVFASVKIQNHNEAVLDAFETEVLQYPEIVSCFSMSGESDYLLRVLASSIENYEQFLKRVLLNLPGVGSVNSSFAMKQLKQTIQVPV